VVTRSRTLCQVVISIKLTKISLYYDIVRICRDCSKFYASY